MDPVRHLARPLLAGIFITGGLDAFRHPETKAALAENVTEPLGAALNLPLDTTTWVQINAAAQVVAGLALTTRHLPRTAALVLAGSLGFTTVAGHPFWTYDDESERSQQRVQFLKNMAILGGLLETSLDTGGRPSIRWRATRRLHDVTDTLHDAVAHTPVAA